MQTILLIAQVVDLIAVQEFVQEMIMLPLKKNGVSSSMLKVELSSINYQY